MMDMSMGDFKVTVETTSGRGFTPEEVAHMCVEKLVYLSDKAPPAIRQQAEAYKGEMEKVIAGYMKQAIQSDRTTVYNAITDAGHSALAEHIRKM